MAQKEDAESDKRGEGIETRGETTSVNHGAVITHQPIYGRNDKEGSGYSLVLTESDYSLRTQHKKKDERIGERDLLSHFLLSVYEGKKIFFSF